MTLNNRKETNKELLTNEDINNTYNIKNIN